jgi:hypothetical protein
MAASNSEPLWGKGLGLGGYSGTWGNMPYLGLRGTIPLSHHLSIRLSWSLLFATQREPPISFSGISVGFLVQLPSPIPSIRNYAVTKLDVWPMWNFLNTNPELSKISEGPTFGLSILLGMEFFLVHYLAFMFEIGFSSGMIIGLAPIQRPFEAFGLALQSGIQLYF